MLHVFLDMHDMCIWKKRSKKKPQHLPLKIMQRRLTGEPLKFAHKMTSYQILFYLVSTKAGFGYDNSVGLQTNDVSRNWKGLRTIVFKVSTAVSNADVIYNAYFRAMLIFETVLIIENLRYINFFSGKSSTSNCGSTGAIFGTRKRKVSCHDVSSKQGRYKIW